MKKTILCLIVFTVLSCEVFTEREDLNPNNGIIALEENLPSAAFTGKRLLLLNEVAEFSAEDSSDDDGEIVEYLWDMGDGTTLYGETISHEYSEDGTYIVLLTVTDNDGKKGYMSKSVKVYIPNKYTVNSTNDRFVTIENFQSLVMDDIRNIQVYLPESYNEDPERLYPVLFANDGQWYFNTESMQNVSDTLVEQGEIEEIIIVAIHTVNRLSEYRITDEAPSYAEFVTSELVPYIRALFRVSHNPEETAVWGSSYGGIISYYLAWNYPEIFGMASLQSPSVWEDGLIMVKQVNESINSGDPIKNIKWWIDVGDDEGGDAFDDDYEMGYIQGVPHYGGNGFDIMEEDAYGLALSLLDRGYLYGDDIRFDVGFNQTHNFEAWRNRMYNCLRFFFGTEENVVTERIEASSSLTDLSLAADSFNFFIYVKEYFSNGGEVVVPLTEVEISCNNEEAYTVSDDTLIEIDKNVITEPITLQFYITYNGLTSSFNINIVD